jgi:hypothetical protein
VMLGQPDRVLAQVFGLDREVDVPAVELRVAELVAVGIAKRLE